MSGCGEEAWAFVCRPLNQREAHAAFVAAIEHRCIKAVVPNWCDRRALRRQWLRSRVIAAQRYADNIIARGVPPA